MKIKKIILPLLLLGIAVISLTLVSCEPGPNERGYDYYPEMGIPWSYETYAPNPMFPDGRTAQYPPEHTIPRNIIPYQ